MFVTAMITLDPNEEFIHTADEAAQLILDAIGNSDDDHAMVTLNVSTQGVAGAPPEPPPQVEPSPGAPIESPPVPTLYEQEGG